MLAGFAGYDTPRAVFFDVAILQVQFLDRLLRFEARGDSTGAVLVKVYMPVVVSGVVGQTVQNTVENPQSQFWDKVFVRVVVSGAVGQTVQNTRGVSTGAVLGQGVHARCCVWC